MHINAPFLFSPKSSPWRLAAASLTLAVSRYSHTCRGGSQLYET